MKKLMSILLVLLMLTSVLASCGGNDESTTTEAPTTEAPTTEAPTTESPTTTPPADDSTQKEMITVTFDSNGGTDLPSQTTEKGAKVKMPDDTIREGYTFDGWYVNGEKWSFSNDVAENNVTMVAKWTPREYKITYVLNGGINNEKNKDTYTIEEGLKLKAPSKEGKSFYGWYTDSKFTKKVTEIKEGETGDKTFYARWKATSDPVLIFEADGEGYRVKTCLVNIDKVIIPASYNGLPVTSIGDSAFANCSYLESITIPDSVTSIGGYAFNGCTSLTSVAIPDSVTNIGEGAFLGCSDLESITIPDDVTSINMSTFYGCTSLTGVNIPDSVTSIGLRAFYGCSSLTSVTIHGGIVSIREGAFGNCASLTNISISNNNEYYKSIDGVLFSKNGKTLIAYPEGKGTSYDIPNHVTSIGKNVFEACESLTNVTIPSSVTSIGAEAFLGCTSLTSITIPDSVTFIGGGSFARCTSLASITIPDSVTSIGVFAFDNCTSITSATIPTIAIKYIPKDNLKTVTIIGGASIDGFSNCTVLESITISNVYSINKNAFKGCASLKSITILDGLVSINLNAFKDCTSLTNITIPDSVTSIGSYAFEGCTSLTSITIPESVIAMGNDVFSNCSSITVKCEVESAPEFWLPDWNSANVPVVWGYKAK